MLKEAKEQIKIDLDQFKLHIHIEQGMELSLHFDSPSRRFYLSVIALVVNEMKRLDRIAPISLESHLEVLALLNETVGASAGSSKKENLIPRIYKKWKGALPDIENAPLFRIPGKKKEYDDTIEKTYRFSEEVKDAWANLFDYKGSEEKVRLRFSIDRIGVKLDNVAIIYGEELDLRDDEAWEKFIDDLKQKDEGKTKPKKASINLTEEKSWPHINIEITKKPWHRIALVAAIVLITGIAITAVWKVYWRSPPVIEPASLDRMAFPLPEKPSIAVLPFFNLSGDLDQEYIADGITENLISSLSQLPEMFVIAQNSVFTYKGKPVKVQQVSEELSVRYVLEGGVQKTGYRLRVTAQLIDAITGRHLWSDRYDRELKDLFVVQDEITMKIVTALQVKLTEGEQARLMAKGTSSIEAYLKFMKGREIFVRFTKNENHQVRRIAKEIIALDPEYPRGYILLGWTHAMDARRGWSKSREGSLARAIVLARKALELDDALARPHALLAYVHKLKKEWNLAIAEAERAVSLAHNPENIFQLAALLHTVERPEEAIVLFKKGIRLDPLPPPWVTAVLGRTYIISRQYNEALDQFKQLLDLSKTGEFDPETAHRWLAAIYVMLDQEEEAQKHATEMLRINPGFSLESYVRRLPYKNPTDIDRLIDAWRKAGLK